MSPIRTFENRTPKIDPLAVLDPLCLVIGDVHIGANTSLWPGVVVRGDIHQIRIGSDSNIQDGCVLHVSHDGPFMPGGSALLIGDRVTVGHRAVLHGCTIGDDCLIGMGSILLDNAVVEPWAFVAAGTLVPPGKVVRAGTLVMGNPMRVVRECTEKDREWIVHSWRSYVKRAREYLERDHARGRGRDRER